VPEPVQIEHCEYGEEADEMDFEANKEQRPRQTPSDFHKAQFSISVDERNTGSV
jgi:hypothetical protein